MPKIQSPWTEETKQRAVELARGGLGSTDIGAGIGVNYKRVGRLLRAIGVKPRRYINERFKTWTRERDSAVAEMYRSGQTLKQIAERLKSNTNRVTESLERSGMERREPYKFGARESNPAWSGSRPIDKDGYVLVRDPAHPNARKSGYVAEHRMVMANALGRPLKKTEVVHHKRAKSENSEDALKVYASNAEHLRDELTGRIPNWTEDGKRRITARFHK